MENSVGIKTTGADTYVAAFTAAEQAEGKSRVVQIISLTSGKMDPLVGSPTRGVSVNDTLDITTVTGSVSVGDNAYFACYLRHTQPAGSCLVTPLLCDDGGTVVGCLPSKISRVMLPVASGTNYISNCLSWPVMETGAWKIYPHVTDLSLSNTVDMWCFTF